MRNLRELRMAIIDRETGRVGEWSTECGSLLDSVLWCSCCVWIVHLWKETQRWILILPGD